MELVDRYLQSVRFWLPRGQKQDIIAELSEDIRSQVEEREAGIGRPLAEAELEGLLRERGRPLLVANSYLPRQHLIGPVWFPVYTFVLKIVAACYLLPSLVVRVFLVVFDPSSRYAHAGNAGMGLLSAWSDFWLAAFLAFGGVTVVFAVLERAESKSGFLQKWDPRKLPPVRDLNRIPRSSSVIDLVANLAFAGWWMATMRSPVVLDRPGLHVTLAPVWPYFFWGLLLLAGAHAAVAATNLVRPYWTRPKAGMRLVTNLAGSALFCAICRINILAELSVAEVSSARTVAIMNEVNLWMSRAFVIAVIIGVVVLAVDVARIVRIKAR
jgi:hypothetical protein